MDGRQMFSSVNSPLVAPSLKPPSSSWTHAHPTADCVSQLAAATGRGWPTGADRMPATTRPHPLRHLRWTRSSATLPGSSLSQQRPGWGGSSLGPSGRKGKTEPTSRKTVLSAADQPAARTAPYAAVPESEINFYNLWAKRYFGVGLYPNNKLSKTLHKLNPLYPQPFQMKIKSNGPGSNMLGFLQAFKLTPSL